jgi:hypothetical protein
VVLGRQGLVREEFFLLRGRGRGVGRSRGQRGRWPPEVYGARYVDDR